MRKFFATIIFMMMFASQVSAMNLTLYESVGSISLSPVPFELKIDGFTKLDGNFSKGVATFNDDLYFHFDCKLLSENFEAASRFGGENFSNTVPVYVFEGMTKIFPITGDGREFYLLATETGGGNSMKVIGDRNGSWVKYFDTSDMRKQMPQEFYLENFYAEGDTIIFLYKEWQQENFCELRYTWNENAHRFGVELIYR